MKTLSPSPLPSPSRGEGTWLPRSKLRGIVSRIDRGRALIPATLLLQGSAEREVVFRRPLRVLDHREMADTCHNYDPGGRQEFV